MAVDKGWYLDQFLKYAEQELRPLHQEDYTAEIQPCLERLQSLAWRFLRRPRLAATIKKAMPLVAQNSIAGLLMPDLFASGAWRYKMIVLQKKDTSTENLLESS